MAASSWKGSSKVHAELDTEPRLSRIRTKPSYVFVAPRIIQITSDDYGGIYALRDDGSVWHKPAGEAWQPVADIQEEN